jgi:hypothetical protein
MMRDAPAAVSPDIARIFQELMDEESRQVIRERRSTHRQPLIRPVKIFLKGQNEGQPAIEGFSKNCSPSGLGIVTRCSFETNPIAILEVHRLLKVPARILAECRWSDQFGDGWYYSGWHFLSLARS